MRIARRNHVLGGVLVVLVLALVALRRPGPERREIVDLLPGFQASAAVHISLEEGGEGVGEARRLALLRTDSGWVLPQQHGYPASERLVEGLLDQLRALSTLDLLSEDPASHGQYGVDAAGTSVTVRDAEGGLLAALVQGEQSADRRAHYVRRRGEDAVYRAPRLMPLVADARRWLEPRWLGFEPTLVAEIDLDGSEVSAPRRLVREEGTVSRWYDSEGGAVSGAAVRRFLEGLSALFVEQVVAADFDAGRFGAPRLEVRLGLADGREFAALLGAEQDGRCLAARGREGWMVLLPGRSVADLIEKARGL